MSEERYRELLAAGPAISLEDCKRIPWMTLYRTKLSLAVEAALRTLHAAA